MAFPPGVAVSVATFGPYLSDSGKPLTGTVTVSASRNLMWLATGALILPAPEKLVIDSVTGMVTTTVARTDQDGFGDGAGGTVKNWTYTANTEIAGLPVIRAVFPAIQDTIQVNKLTSVDVAPGVTYALPVVTSVNGQTGAVTVTGGSGSGSASSVDDLAGTGATGRALMKAATTNAGLAALGIDGLAALVTQQGQAIAALQDALTALQTTVSDGLASKIDVNQIGAVNGVAGLDASKILAMANMPSSVLLIAGNGTTATANRPATPNSNTVLFATTALPANSGTNNGGTTAAVKGQDRWLAA